MRRRELAGQLAIDYRDALPAVPEQITIFAALPREEVARICQLELMQEARPEDRRK